MSILSRLLRSDSGGDGNVLIEPMRRSHVRDVLAIEEQVYPKPWTTGVFTSELDLARKGQRNYVVAVIDGALVGYGGMMFAPDEAHVTNIAVDPRVHRRGVATRVLLHLVRDAVSRGYSALTLEVRMGNEAAREMYRRFGFAPAGVRQRYYENREDALVMWAHDVDGDDYARRLDDIEAGLS